MTKTRNAGTTRAAHQKGKRMNRIQVMIKWLQELLPKQKKPTPTKPAGKTKLGTPKPPPVPTATKRFGIDVAWGTIPMADLKKHGVSFVIRYLSRDPSKNLHDDYADELLKAGIDTVCIWETTAERAKAGKLAGVADAKEARKQATECGMPKGRPIYFAVDFNAQGPEVAPYFWGVNSVLSTTGSGIYGGYSAVKYMMYHGIVKFGWQTYGWSKGMWVAKAQLFQYSNAHTIAGVEVDYDHTAAASDFGQWRA